MPWLIWASGRPLYSKQRQEYFDRIEVGVPADLPLAEANLGISRFVQQFGGQVLSASERRGQVEIRGGFGEVQTTTFILAPVPERRRTGNIAIVIDDFDDTPIAAHFCAIPQPLTFSVLPKADRAQALVERVRAQRARGVGPPADGTQRRGISRCERHTSEPRRRGNPPPRTPRLAERAPTPAGSPTHMGSKATADERVMRLVLSELKDRKLLFLDSRTTASSVAYQPSCRYGYYGL